MSRVSSSVPSVQFNPLSSIPFGNRTRVWSRSRFRHAFQPLPRYLTRENSTGLKHAGKESLQNSQVRCLTRRHVARECDRIS